MNSFIVKPASNSMMQVFHLFTVFFISKRLIVTHNNTANAKKTFCKEMNLNVKQKF